MLLRNSSSWKAAPRSSEEERPNEMQDTCHLLPLSRRLRLTKDRFSLQNCPFFVSSFWFHRDNGGRADLASPTLSFFPLSLAGPIRYSQVLGQLPQD